MTDGRLTLRLIRDAHRRIRSVINHTPVMTSRALNALTGAELYFKCENFQKVGAFKARGAANAVLSLSYEEARRGVATHSSGNHAAALARAAQLRRIPAYIVMPNNAAKVKQASARRYGATVISCEPTFDSRESTAQRVIAETGAVFIHPFDDLRVMAGQGTATLELLEEVSGLDIILCPVGGGGLLSGTAVAAKTLSPGIRVIAIEPTGADDASRSFKSGRIVAMASPKTIADGLRTSLSPRTFAEIQNHVDDIVTVTDEEIIDATRTMWEIMKIIIEPSAALPTAALLQHKLDAQDKRIGIILTGGNIDLDALPWSKASP